MGADSHRVANLEATQWTAIGPSPIDAGTANGFWSGRVKAVAVDPDDENVVYVGAATGGVWKSRDAGESWSPLMDSQPSLIVGSLALDPSNPDIVYVGTGEGSYGFAYSGVGILKSTDGGATWQHLRGSFSGPITVSKQGGAIVSLAVHPGNGEILLAGVLGGGSLNSGVYRSRDGGMSWTLATQGAPQTDVIFDPSDPNVAYIGLGPTTLSAVNGVYRSGDAGLTWSAINGSGPNALPTTDVAWRTLAIAPSSPKTLYMTLARADGSLIGMFKTTDAGATWRELRDAPDHCSPSCVNFASVLAVHPADSSAVFLGGVTQKLFRSLDGGGSWTSIARGANITVHGDEHALAFSKDGRRLYVGDDGGVYSTTDVRTAPVIWRNLNATLGITQFYAGISMHPTNRMIGFGGTQDNGLLKFADNKWVNLIRGDSAGTLIDPTDPNVVYGYVWGTFGNQIHKSTAGGEIGTWKLQVTGINAGDRGSNLPFVMDPSNPKRLYFGTFRVYQSNDGAGSWTPISPDLAGAGQALRAIAVAPSDPNTVYVGSFGKVSMTTRATDGVGAQWVDRSAGVPGRAVTQIAVDHSVPTTVYVLMGHFSGFSGDTKGHVLKSTDGGLNWRDISSNLPNLPANDIVIDPDMTNTLYVATDSGVFVTTDAEAKWARLGDGLPNVPVLALRFHPASGILRAGTHGRGMWDILVR